jgi:hypothetical protein
MGVVTVALGLASGGVGVASVPVGLGVAVGPVADRDAVGVADPAVRLGVALRVGDGLTPSVDVAVAKSTVAVAV